MEDPINAADNKMITKAEIMSDQENDTKSTKPKSEENLDLKPVIKDVITFDQATVNEENISNAEVKCEIDIKDIVDHKNKTILQESGIETDNYCKSDSVSMDTAGASVEVKPYTYIKQESIINSGVEITETTGQEDKQDKPKKYCTLKRKRYRNRVKMRLSKKAKLLARKDASKQLPASDPQVENIDSPEEETSDDVEYCLKVTNLPNSWSFMDIKNYIDTQCGPVDEIEMVKDDRTGNGAIRLSYRTEDECKKAMEKLEDKEIEGTKLTVSMNVIDLSDGEALQSTSAATAESSGTQQSDTTSINKPWKPDMDIWDIDPKGTYGLKESYLKSLDITPPLDKWVHVSNFRSDKSDLRDLLELAGRVLACAVYSTPTKYANVEYSHPLEAVQAVSMLNGQNFYGQPIRVVMERCPVNTVLLPKGLTGIGTGLGCYGKPLRNITQHYRRYITNQMASINRLAFEDPPNPNENLLEDEFQVKKVDEFNHVIPQKVERKVIKVTEQKSDSDRKLVKNTPNPKAASVEIVKQSTSIPAQSPTRPQNLQPTNKPNMTQFGPRPIAAWPMQGPFGPRLGPRPGWNGPGQMRPMGGPMQGPRPMRPMGGPMQGMPGPMQGMPGPMQGMPGPMQGMPGPMQGMPGPMQGMPGPMQGMPGPMQGMPGPMQGMPGSMQGMPGPMQGMPGPMQGMPGPMQGSMGQSFSAKNPVQMHLTNLPASTTFALLCEKMAACGPVESLQLPAPGAAVVVFSTRAGADMCYQLYNNACIEGYIIKVAYA